MCGICRLKITDGAGFEQTIPCRLLGPYGPGKDTQPKDDTPDNVTDPTETEGLTP